MNDSKQIETKKIKRGKRTSYIYLLELMYLSNASVDSVEEAINCRHLRHVYVYQIQTTICIKYSMLILDCFIVIISVSRLLSTRGKPRSLVSSL